MADDRTNVSLSERPALSIKTTGGVAHASASLVRWPSKEGDLGFAVFCDSLATVADREVALAGVKEMVNEAYDAAHHAGGRYCGNGPACDCFNAGWQAREEAGGHV